MPNIPTFNAPALDIRPTETGIDAYQQAARRTGAFYNEAGQSLAQTGARLGSAIKSASELAVQVQEHAEISNGSKNFASLFDNLTQQWNDIASKTPPERVGAAAAQFREQTLEPALEKFGDQGFITDGGQKFAQNHIATLRQHMFEKTAADASTAAGEAVKVNAAQTFNQLASAARNDPSSLDFALKTVETSFGATVDSSPNIKPDLAAQLKTEALQRAKVGIIKSAVLGMIEKNPDIDLSAIQKKYGDLIPGAEMQQFVKAAQVQAKTNLLQDKQLETYQKQQADLKVHKDANDSFSKNVTIDQATNRPVINPKYFSDSLNIAKNNPDAPNAQSTARTLLDWGEHQQNLKDQVIRTDPGTKADLMTGMFNPDKPTSRMDILRAEADGKLSNHDGTILREMVAEQDAAPHRGPVYQSAIEAMKERTGVGLIADGHERFSNAMQVFWPEYNRQLRAGTLPPNALDLRDPKSLISQAIQQYEPDAQTRMMAHSLKNLGLSNLDRLGLPQPSATPAPKPAAPSAIPSSKIIGVEKPTAAPPVGFTKDGFQFMGGDAGDAKNWKKVK